MRRVLVVGSGIAGLTAARTAAAAGHAVTVLTKRGAAVGSTARAQGGIAAAVFADDSVAAHIADTLAAGAGHCDPEAVRVLCAEGPERVRELARLGVAFDTDADGAWQRGLEAAHSSARVVHAGGDATGAHIEAALIAAARAAGVQLREHVALRDLVVRDGCVVGVELLVRDGDTVRAETLAADAVVLASGGFSALYPRTSNPASATGDGIAAALRAGAAVADLEFVQFHPTVLAVGTPFLVSEAVRGEGAWLRDAHGHRFMPDVDPRAELAPRDVVARAIAQAMARCNGAPVGLDASVIAAPAGTPLAAMLAQRFPTIDAAVKARGLDWSREPVPVQPGSHFTMGGIAVDLDGRTSLPGLWAVGEAACNGVHGANRLASNSLLEGAVFGARAGAALGAQPEGGGVREPVRIRAGALTLAELLADGILPPAPEPTAAPFSRAALQALMWREAGLVRDAAGLARAAAQLASWRSGFGDPASAMQAQASASADAAFAALEDANLLIIATALTAAAQRRLHSLGAHYRSDDPAVAAFVAAGSDSDCDPASTQLQEQPC